MNEKMSEKWTIVISVVIPMIGTGVALGALIFSLHTATVDRLDRLEMTLGARIERVEQRLSARIDRLEERIAGVGQRVARIEGRLEERGILAAEKDAEDAP